MTVIYLLLAMSAVNWLNKVIADGLLQPYLSWRACGKDHF
jgi:hypothetical protein